MLHNQLIAAGFTYCDTPNFDDTAYVKEMPVKDMPYAAECLVDGIVACPDDTAVIEVTKNGVVSFRFAETDYAEEQADVESEEGLDLLRDAGVDC